MELSRRNILVALVVIGLASAGAGAGTMALFSDTESSTGNSVQAGTLDLTIDGEDSDVSFSEGDIAPGFNTTETYELNNAGSLNGSLDVNITNVNNSGGEYPEPEEDQVGANNADLGQYITISLVDSSDSTVAEVDGANATVGELVGNVTLESGETYDLVIDVDVPETAENELQGDYFEVSLEIELNQEDSQ